MPLDRCETNLTGISLDDDVLVALPELYRFGREGTWFGTKLFLLYILDAVYQVNSFT